MLSYIVWPAKNRYDVVCENSAWEKKSQCYDVGVLCSRRQHTTVSCRHSISPSGELAPCQDGRWTDYEMAGALHLRIR